jgi:WhiB family redox-sensing transcriptional regulator
MGEPALEITDVPWGVGWMDLAACKGQTHLFFPPLAERPQARARREARARRFCDICPVQGVCRQFAREHAEYGLWGGEAEDERTLAGYPVPNPIGGRSLKRTS